MLGRIKERIYRVSRAAGVEIVLLPDNRCKIIYTLLALDKNAIVIEKKECLEEGNIEGLKLILNSDVPVSVIFNGRGILHKKVSNADVDDASLIQSVLPNAKAQDFHSQSIISEKSTLVSIVRKEVIDPFLESFKKNNLFAVYAGLGATTVTSVLPLIKEFSENKNVSWPGHTLELDSQNEVVDYKAQGDLERKYFKIDNENLESDFLISYGAAFALLTGAEIKGMLLKEIGFNKEEFQNKQLFQKLSWSLLGFFLIILMINFVLFTNYSSRNNELVQKEIKYKSMFTEMENLGKDVKEKEVFLSEAGWLQASSTSYFADRIAASVPGSVKLTELTVNPLDERKSKELKKDQFLNNIIILKGDCTRPTELNEWLDKIKSIDKITKAKLVQYVYDNKENKGSFSIEIETIN